MWWTSYLLLVANAFLTLSHGARILVVFPMSSHSHFTLGFRLAKELADRGHQVTFINAFPQKEPIKNLREISVAEMNEAMNKIKVHLYQMGTLSYIGQSSRVSNLGHKVSEAVFKVTEVQGLLQSNEQFDLVLIEYFVSEALAIFQHKFKCPLIVVAPGPTSVLNNHLFANPSQPAYVPNAFGNFGSHMTLWERILNVYYDIIGELHVQFVHIPMQNEILQRNVPGAPNLSDILYNASFLLIATHISLQGPAPLQPNVKEIGGYHVLPPRPLPKGLQQFLDNANEGAIVFSMGGNLKSANFPEPKKKAILKVFSRVKQKVLWKFETDLARKPNNVKTMSWIPQQDVLAHPNVILFITHGGLLGKTEAVYHGVPLLGLPVYSDQWSNINDAVSHGFALSIPFPQLNEDNFEWALKELINNPKYRENAKLQSRIMHDQPMKQMDKAMFWIEYVIRHKGAPHYRSPAMNLKWYQKLLLDVIVVLSIIWSTIFVIVFYILKRFFNSLNKNVIKTIKKE